MEQPSLYMWAIVPPPALSEEIDRIRHAFAEQFRCYKALRPPVHLTLYQPFHARDGEFALHIDALKAWLRIRPAFTLTLRDFGFFERSRSPVVFIDVVPSDPLAALSAGLSRETVRIFGLPPCKDRFHPHFTIGYRDVSPAIFPQVKVSYSRRTFSAEFDVDAVSLFRHNGVKWALLHECPLSAVRDGAPANPDQKSL